MQHNFGRSNSSRRHGKAMLSIIMAALINFQSAIAGPACSPGPGSPGRIEILHAFRGTKAADGQDAWAAPVIDGNGAIYGTTRGGGRFGRGILYRWQPGLFKILHDFSGADGQAPLALVSDSFGNLYGIAEGGPPPANGVIFRYDTELGYGIIKAFGGAAGALPLGGMVRDAAGNLYGTARYGGDPGCSPLGCGTLFRVDSRCVGVEDWSADPFCSINGYSVLHRFGLTGGSFNPNMALIRAGSDLYGGTSYSLFRLTESGFHVLRTYDSTAFAYTGQVRDPNTGLIYGVASPGVIYRMDGSGSLTILYRFTGRADGSRPNAGLVIAAGKLYGTTLGAYTDADPAATDGANNGTVFELDIASGTIRTLYTFDLCDRGLYGNKPVGGLSRDASGNLYGVTHFGGAHGHGVLYRITLR